jgi:PAS domain S-box-containing protein
MQAQKPPRQGPDGDQRETPARVQPAGDRRSHDRHDGRIPLRAFRVSFFLSIAFLVSLSWLDEILDLPHLLFNMPATPANLAEASIESVFFLATGIFIYVMLSRILLADKENEQERKREKILSEVVINESPSLFQAFNPDGSIILVSRHTLDVLGYSFEEVIGKNYLTLFVAPKEREELGRKVEDLLRTGIPARGENHLMTKDGREILLQWEARAAYKENGEIDFVYGPGVDITQQKELELALRQSEERYRTFIQNLQGIAYQGDMNFTSLFIYGDVEQITGYSTEEFISGAVRVIDLIHPEDLNAVSSAIARLQTIPNHADELIYRIFRKDGQVSWVRDLIRNTCGESGVPIAMQGIVYDITKEKEAEALLRRSEAQYRLLAENAKDVIWAVDTDFQFTYVSPSSVRMSGFTAEEVMNIPFAAMYTLESREMIREYISQASVWFREGLVPEDQHTLTIESQRYRKDGSIIWVEVTTNVIFDEEGKPTGLVGVTRDITQRKRAEEEMRKSEERYRLLAENITDVIWAMDKDMNYTYISPSVEKIRGYTVEEAMRLSGEQVYSPRSYQEVKHILARAYAFAQQGEVPASSRARTFEAELLCKDGSTIWAEVTASFVFDQAGKPSGFVGVTRDITQRKRAEEDLRRSDAQYRLLAEHVDDVIWALEADLQFSYMSPSVEKMSGYTVEQVLSMPMAEYLTERSYKKVSQLLAQTAEMIAQGEMPEDNGPLTFKISFVCRDGSTKWAEVRSAFIAGPDGKPAGGVGVARDITERIKSETALRQSEEMYRTIFESTGTAMIIVEEDGTISLVNEEFEKLSGYSSEEIEGGMTWRDFAFSGDAERLSGYHALRKSDPDAAPRNYEFRFIDRHGMIKDAFATSTLFPGTKRVLLSLQDITQSKLSAEELRLSQEQLRNLLKHSQDVRERERTRVAREIHDELGQVLTGLKMDLSFLAKKLPPELTELNTKTNLMLRFVDMTIQSVKRITMDLRPGLLDHLGLVAAIEWQAEEFQKRSGIRYRISVVPDEIILEPEQSTAVFRIFQETLTNISKYAHANEVNISLMERGGVFEMTVSDNGVGITKEQMENPKSYGLMGIQERAYFSGGKAKIFGQKGKGTTVKVTIPIDQMRSIDDTSAYRG